MRSGGSASSFSSLSFLLSGGGSGCRRFSVRFRIEQSVFLRLFCFVSPLPVSLFPVCARRLFWLLRLLLFFSQLRFLQFFWLVRFFLRVVLPCFPLLFSRLFCLLWLWLRCCFLR